MIYGGVTALGRFNLYQHMIQIWNLKCLKWLQQCKGTLTRSLANKCAQVANSATAANYQQQIWLQNEIRPQIRKKQEALRLLEALGDGTFTAARVNPDTKKAWTGEALVIKYGVRKETLFGWKAEASNIMSISANSRAVKITIRIKSGAYPDNEKQSALPVKNGVAYHFGTWVGAEIHKVIQYRKRARRQSSRGDFFQVKVKKHLDILIKIHDSV